MSTYKDMGRESSEHIAEDHPPRAASALSSHRTPSSRFSFGSSAGRPLAQGPREVFVRKNVSPSQYQKTRKVSPGTAYLENAQRRREKEEARSLRDALEADDELRIHQAAQDEATELVWVHQNPDAPAPNPYAPYRNPDMDGSPKAGRSQRQSLGNRMSLVSGSPRNRASHHLPGGDHGLGIGNDADVTSKAQGDGREIGHERNGTARKGRKVDFALPAEDSPESVTRKASGDSSKGIFRNPNDQIYEEPKDTRDQTDPERPIPSQADISALRAKPRNSLLRGSRPFPGRFSSPEFANKLARFDIHKKPPSQSRDPQYKMNEPVADFPNTKGEQEPSPTKDGREIRGDDIRAATSKKLTDRSEKLPMPSAVSDRVGRPIVSFDSSWKASEVQPERSRDSPSKHENASPTPRPQPAPPTIEVSDTPTIPVINVPDEEPTISQMERTSKPGSKAQHAGTSRRSPAALQDRWRSSYSRSGVPTARCESCTLPIAGRIVTAAGSRFHPECFICSHCQTPLECVAFYQEPEAKRNERLANTARDDEEAQALRFYCALDFHEMFSPRCKSCKTPIEGEVVVACGAEWHVGHFFCAECGDV